MRCLTVLQIAKNLGVSRRKAQARAIAESWLYKEEPYRRTKRRLYPFKSLPEPIQKKIIAASLDQMELPGVLAAALEEAEDSSISVLRPSPTPPPSDSQKGAAAAIVDWQKPRMEARAALVREVERLGGAVGIEQAIREIVSRAQAGSLPDHLQRLVPAANAKGGSSGTRTLSVRTLKRWRAAMKNGVAALAPKARDRGPLPAWAMPLLKLYRQPQKSALTDCVGALRTPGALPEGVVPPSYPQARRFIKGLGSVEKERGRMGQRELRNIQPFRRRNTSHMAPGDCYTADGHTFDAEIAHPEHGRPFRPEMTLIIDVATRRAVGWSVGLAESALTVLDALRHAVETHGIPSLFYVDNGSGYKNDMMTDSATGLMARLGITMTHSLPYNSQARGIIERAHQNIWVRLAKTLSTYMGQDMDPEAKKLAFKVTRRTGQWLPAWAEFLELAGKAIDHYNHNPHRSLPKVADAVTGRRRHQTPLEAWDGAIAQGWAPEVPEDTDALFRPRVRRAIRRGEIGMFGQLYFHHGLEEWHGERLEVGYDIHDGSRAWVYDPDGRLICVAERDGNRSEYFPQSFIEQAREERAKGRLRRLEVKREEIELGSARPESPAETVPLTDEERDLARTYAARMEPPPLAPQPETGRPVFAGEFAERDWGKWVLERWETVDAKERALFRRRCESPVYRELMGMMPEDLAALAG